MQILSCQCLLLLWCVEYFVDVIVDFVKDKSVKDDSKYENEVEEQSIIFVEWFEISKPNSCKCSAAKVVSIYIQGPYRLKAWGVEYLIDLGLRLEIPRVSKSTSFESHVGKNPW